VFILLREIPLNLNEQQIRKGRIEVNNNHQKIAANAIVGSFAFSLQFYLRLNRSFLEAFSVPFTGDPKDILEIKTETFSDHRDYLNYNG
jgi:hypothetical protein